MKEIILHGILKEKYGETLRWQVDSPKDALRGMMTNFPDFRKELSSGSFQIILGTPESGLYLTANDLDFRMPDTYPLHIIPVPEGRGGMGGSKKGIATVIIGAIILVTAFFTGGATLAGLGAALPGMLGSMGMTYGSLALTGLALIMAGISSMLTPKIKTPKYKQRESPEERASFLFQSGTVNTSEQGGCVPLVVGRFRTGSVSVSAGIRTEQIA